MKIDCSIYRLACEDTKEIKKKHVMANISNHSYENRNQNRGEYLNYNCGEFLNQECNQYLNLNYGEFLNQIHICTEYPDPKSGIFLNQ